MMLTFEDATPDALEKIVEIYNSVIPGRMVTADTEPVSCEDKLEWFLDHNPETRPLWLVKDEDKIIGWVSFNDFYGRPAYAGTCELSIYLDETARGKGYGKEILQTCIQRAPALSIHTLLGFIFSHNLPSMQLFSQAGFEEWGVLKDVAIMDGNSYSLSILGKKIA